MNKYGWLAVGTALGLMLGGFAGFITGVASTKFGQEMLEGMVSWEQRANVKDAKTYTSKTLTFRYPGNWKLETQDPDFHAEYYIPLETPGGAAVYFTLHNGKSDVKEYVEEHANTYVQSLVTDPKRRRIRRWGSYEGYGVEIRGRIRHINRGGVTIFSHSGETRTLFVTEIYYDDDLAKVKPGFELIRQTFQLK
ncbi:MAG: hypothetical protein KY468_14645 [Armatimonadetes bacterium]|nr:hypothetical protein [Armatimonadota bacterium]